MPFPAIRTLRAKCACESPSRSEKRVEQAFQACVLFLQIYMLDIFDGMTEKPLTEPPEFLHRISSKELEPRPGPPFLASSECGRQ